jgi:hypothetical protein
MPFHPTMDTPSITTDLSSTSFVEQQGQFALESFHNKRQDGHEKFTSQYVTTKLLDTFGFQKRINHHRKPFRKMSSLYQQAIQAFPPCCIN